MMATNSCGASRCALLVRVTALYNTTQAADRITWLAPKLMNSGSNEQQIALFGYTTKSTGISSTVYIGGVEGQSSYTNIKAVLNRTGLTAPSAINH
jgi:hypothetical protein